MLPEPYNRIMDDIATKDRKDKFIRGQIHEKYAYIRRCKMQQQQTLEDFIRDTKLPALKSSSFYGSKPVTQEEIQRVVVLEDILQEYQEKKQRGWLVGRIRS